MSKDETLTNQEMHKLCGHESCNCRSYCKKKEQEPMTPFGLPLFWDAPAPRPDGSLINEGTKKLEPVAFFKTADLKAAWEAGYSAGRIAPLENKSTKVGTIGHIGDGKTTLTAAITPLLTEYKIGQEVKVTRLTYGGAVYNSKGEIINANQPPYKTVRIGRIVEIKQECENGAVVVKCEGSDKFLPRFHFYPQDNGPDLIVEVLGQPKKPEQEPVVLMVYRGELCYKSQEDDQSFGMWCPVTQDLPFPEGTKFYTTPLHHSASR